MAKASMIFPPEIDDRLVELLESSFGIAHHDNYSLRVDHESKADDVFGVAQELLDALAFEVDDRQLPCPPKFVLVAE